MQRIKKVELDNVTYEIGSLSLGQARAFVTEQRQALGLDEKGTEVSDPDADALEKIYVKLVMDGLNNALRSASPESTLYTVARVQEEIDLVAFAELRNEMMNFSGLMPKKSGVAETKSVGEGSAAS